MFNIRQSLATFVILALVLPLFAQPAAATPRLTLDLQDTVLAPGREGYLTIYVTNPVDSIAGIELLVRSDRPDLVSFLPSYDTTGTLLAHWEYVANYYQPDQVKIVGLADWPTWPRTPPTPPGTFPRPLLKLRVQSALLPDSAVDRSAAFSIVVNLDDFGVSDSHAQLIGLVNDTIVDTVCYQCVEWQGSLCMRYTPVTAPPCDTTMVDTSITGGYFDTAAVHVSPGSVWLGPCCVGKRGNVDYDSSDRVNLIDLSAMISYLATGGASLRCPTEADLDASGRVNLVDLTTLIAFLTGGQVPVANCP